MSEPRRQSQAIVAAIVGVVALFGLLSIGRCGQSEGPKAIAGTDDGVARPAQSSPAPEAAREPHVGDVVMLIDVSGSTRPEKDEAIRTIASAIEALRGVEEILPIRFRVATIGDRGLDQRPICDLYVSRRTLFTANDSTVLSKGLQDCSATAAIAGSTRFTDIRGSVKFASAAQEGESQRLRLILVVSDLKEELAPGSQPAIIDLSGRCVMTYVQTSGSGPNPGGLDLRIRSWRDVLVESRVALSSERLLVAWDPADLVLFARSCARATR